MTSLFVSMRFLIIVIIVLLGTQKWAQFNELIIQKPNSSNKLSNGTIYSICQSQLGYVFLGTDDGLVKYNGLCYEPVPLKTNGQSVHNLICDGETLYGLTFQKELFKFENSRLEVFDSEDLAISKFSSIEIIGDSLYVFDTKHFQILDKNTMQVVYERTDEDVPLTWGVYELSGNVRIVHGDNDIVSLYDYDSLKFNELEGQLESWPVVFEFMRDKFLFDLKRKEISRWQSGLFIPMDWKFSYLDNQKIHTIGAYRNTCVISTYNGIYLLNEHGELLYHLLKGVPVSRTYEDKEGQLWIATLNDGVYMISNLNSSIVDLRNILDEKDKIHRAKIVKDDLYFGTHHGNLYKFSDTLNHISSVKLGKDAEVQSISKVNSSYFVYCEKLYELDADLNILNTVGITATKCVAGIHEKLLLGTSKGIFEIESDDTIRLFEDKWFRSMYLNPDSSYVVANTDYGSYQYSSKNANWTSDPSVYQYQSYQGIEAYLKNDVIKLKHDEIEKEVPISSEFEHYFLADDLVIVVENNAIVLYDAHTIGKIATYRKNFDYSENKIIACGVLNNELLIVFDDHLQLIQIGAEKLINQPKVVLRSSDKNSVSKSLELTYQGSLSLTFDVLFSYLDKGKTAAFYRVSGIENEWRKIDAGEVAYELFIERIPSGSHLLEIKAVSTEGVSSEILTFQINVAFPYWQKWWFVVAVVIGITFIGFLILKIRITQIKKKNKKELQIKRLEVQSLNTKLEALRSQMNPHFIFNTINTIQAQIMSEESDDAYDSLNRFAKLIRAALEHSTKNYVSIKDDKEFLLNYLQLEALRFNHELNFSINVDNELENTNPEIPSLLTQPFVENSIKHGLLHKSNGQKILTVSYRKTENAIEIVITDNGVGREASKEINESNKKNKPKSYATAAIDKRVQVLNSIDKHRIGINTIDLDGGTQVIIKIARTV